MSDFNSQYLRVAILLAGLVGPLLAPPIPSLGRDGGPVIPAVHAALEPLVQRNEVSGAVAVVVQGSRVVHDDVLGQADREANIPMRADSLFWIASMTKPITATAVMMLQDEGKLSVDDLVAKHIPEFERLTTPEGKPARVTIRHLLTHTSGLTEISSDQARDLKTLAETIPLYLSRPVQFVPGTEWRYCQSGINTAARVVEVVSGTAFPEFLERRLFGPLGMKDTTFYLTDEQARRLARSYRRTDAGALEPAENMILHGKPPTSRDRFPAANGGLFSTAPDYLRFCRMILAGGEFEGRRLLKPESVRLMTTVQTGELKTGFTPGNGWGLGWCVVRSPEGVTAMLAPGTFGHGGAYGTQAWIDPQAQRIYLLMVQRTNFQNPDNSPVRRAFQESATAALGAH